MSITLQSSTKKEILLYMYKQGQATAIELASNLEISPQATRRHLQDLETEELIEHKAIPQKMGRPQHVYRLSRQGRSNITAILAPKAPQHYGEFAVSVLDTIAETVGKDKVTEVLQKQWHKKAEGYRDLIGKGSLRDRVTKLVQLRQEEGFMAELLVVDEEKFFLAEHNCAISEVAQSYPGVCSHELEMFAVLLPDCTVERTHSINNGEHRCGYLIQKKK